MTTLGTVDEASLTGLREQLAGQAFVAADAAYPDLVRAWNLAVRPSPAVVVDAVSAGDVVAAVRFAADQGLPVGVQATGHGIACDFSGAALVRTSRMDECLVHPEEGWARIGAGVQSGRLVEAAARFGLAPIVGSAATVGVVGYTVGAGQGPISRTFGFASDRVRAAELVTGDGVLRRTTAQDEPDLFWALRGGKGAVGLVTALEIDLVPLPQVFAGALYFAGPDIGAVLHGWAEWCAALPEQANTSAALLRLPALPGVPQPLAGRPTIAVRFIWTGDPDDGAKLFAPISELAHPVLGSVDAIPFSAIASVHADPVDPLPSFEDADLLRELPPDAVDALLAVAGPDADSPLSVVELRLLGGAMARRPEVPGLFDRRDPAFSISALGAGAGPLADAVAAHVSTVLSAMKLWALGAVLPNSHPEAGDARAARSYDPQALARLKAIAERYDPQRLFRVGQVPDR